MEVREVAQRAAAALAVAGLRDRWMLLVVSGMVLGAVDYQVAVEALAEMEGCSPERVNADLCYRVLKGGHTVHPSRILSDIADRIKEELQL